MGYRCRPLMMKVETERQTDRRDIERERERQRARQGERQRKRHRQREREKEKRKSRPWHESATPTGVHKASPEMNDEGGERERDRAIGET